MKKLLLAVILLCPFMLTGKNIGFLKQANDTTTYLDCISCKFTNFEYYSGYVPNNPLCPFATVYYDDYKTCFWDWMRIRSFTDTAYDYTPTQLYWNQKTKKGEIVFLIPVHFYE